MPNRPYDVIVVGAGQAGLGVSYYLRSGGCRFVILERGRIAESWRTQRWDSLVVNTPNWMNALPGEPRDAPEPTAFCRPRDIVSRFEKYAESLTLPVKTGACVTSVAQSPGTRSFLVGFLDSDGLEKTVPTRNLVVASGFFRRPKTPAVSRKVPDWIVQLHSSEYRSPSRLPPGAVVVVGSAQSGCQIADDLAAAGRRVYLCTSKVARVPRRYRGRDVFEWWDEMGVFDETVEDLEDPATRRAAQFLISGRGPRGSTLSLQALARRGVRLLGGLADVQNGSLCLGNDVHEHLRYGDLTARGVKRRIDEYIRRAGLPRTPREPEPADQADLALRRATFPDRLPLEAAGVRTIIWCTGFEADFSWVKIPVQDSGGAIVQRRGASSCPGLYFLGLPWMRTRKSGLIHGVEDDARYVARAILRRVRPKARMTS